MLNSNTKIGDFYRLDTTFTYSSGHGWRAHTGSLVLPEGRYMMTVAFVINTTASVTTHLRLNASFNNGNNASGTFGLPAYTICTAFAGQNYNSGAASGIFTYQSDGVTPIYLKSYMDTGAASVTTLTCTLSAVQLG